MRRLIGSLMLLVVLVGCKNQSGSTLTNPFLTPDRVPPPSTRVLAPGTAQPYYAGDPMPSAGPPTGVPTINAPAGTLPLTSPPGGWTYPPQSSVNDGFNGDAVSIPADQQGLRFAGGDSVTPTPDGAASSTPSFNSMASAPALRLPIQSMLPLGGEMAPSGGAPGLGTSRLAPREVTAAEYFAPPSGAASLQLASAEATRDGFRPQGSDPRVASPSDQAFRPPAIRRDAAAAVDEMRRYAAAENYESLRGQLEYWPMTGEWSLRYLAEGAAVDSLGGRVLIENPQVLANLQPGELVTVRGQLFGKATESGAMQPTYRVSGVQRQRQ